MVVVVVTARYLTSRQSAAVVTVRWPTDGGAGSLNQSPPPARPPAQIRQPATAHTHSARMDAKTGECRSSEFESKLGTRLWRAQAALIDRL